MSSLKKRLLEGYVRFIHNVCGIKKEKVVFLSFNGKSYSDNPKAVSVALHRIMPEAKVYWVFKDNQKRCTGIPSYIHRVNGLKTLELYRHYATASVILSNFSFINVPKGKNQMLIQTWHGDKAFKTILHDAPGSHADRVVPEQIEGYCDLAVAGSQYGKHQYESAFRYKGKILMEGTPRNDQLVTNDPERCRALKRTLNIERDAKLLMYAPTLRKEARQAEDRQQIQDLDISSTLDLMEKKDGCKWICLLRAHPSVAGLSGAGEDQRIMDVSGYEDMADLLLISDMLITDYSSCAGDFALLRRPLVLYQSDRQEYLEKDRTFYFDIDESPYFVAQNQNQLEAIITDMTPEKAAKNCNEILEFYGDCETGHAAESVAKIIKDWIER